MVEMKEEEKLKLKKLIKELEKIKGRHTELVSVYIPSGYNLVDAMNQIFQEKGTASNIKSKTTRKNVLTALEKILQHLKLFKKTPPNGLVIFCGNVSPEEGKEDIRLWSYEPPVPISQKIYWCDQTFVLDPLKDLISEKEVYGLIVLDAKEATVGLLKGKRIEKLKTFESTVPSKTVKGGMCVEEDTLIQLEDGNTIPIKYLSKNEKILAYSFEKFTPVFTNSFEIFKRKSKKAYELVFERQVKSLILTPEHKVFVLDKNKVSEKNVEEVKVGDKLLLLTNSKLEKKKNKKETLNLLDKIHNSGVIEIEVKEKKEIISDKEFYDLYVPGVNSFVANGIIVHNSQKRYDRLRDDALNEFLVKVGEEASNLLLKQENLKGVIIGGPGPVKETFYDKKYLHYQLQKKVLGVKDIGSTDEYGLEELVFKSQDLLQEAAISKERELMQKFFSELKNNGNVVYGFEETKKALEAGAVDVLLISEEFNWVHVKFKCNCGFETEKDLPKYLVEKQKCPNCGQKLIEEESKELVDELVEKASSLGARVEYISTETSEGIQFRELGGIGAFLRYKMN